MSTQAEVCRQFQALHQQPEAFVIPNPWDAGTARLLQGMGFKALASTSSGFALTLGKTDGRTTLEEALAHFRALADATEVPINADFENGLADDPAGVADHVRQVVETGVAGCSVEDFSRDGQYLYDFELAVERVAAAAEVVSCLEFPFMLTARAENLLRGVEDLDDTIRRLQAFEMAGASVLYAPGIRTLDDLAHVTAELTAPFNVLGVRIPGATLADFQEAGAKRVSIGGALTYAAMKPVLEAGKAMLEHGDFGWVSNIASGRVIAELLG